MRSHFESFMFYQIIFDVIYNAERKYFHYNKKYDNEFSLHKKETVCHKS